MEGVFFCIKAYTNCYSLRSWCSGPAFSQCSWPTLGYGMRGSWSSQSPVGKAIQRCSPWPHGPRMDNRFTWTNPPIKNDNAVTPSTKHPDIHMDFTHILIILCHSGGLGCDLLIIESCCDVDAKTRRFNTPSQRTPILIWITDKSQTNGCLSFVSLQWRNTWKSLNYKKLFQNINSLSAVLVKWRGSHQFGVNLCIQPGIADKVDNPSLSFLRWHVEFVCQHAVEETRGKLGFNFRRKRSKKICLSAVMKYKRIPKD